MSTSPPAPADDPGEPRAEGSGTAPENAGVLPALPGSSDEPGHGPAVWSLFSELVDDAAVFPPGLAPMAEAVPQHVAHVAAWYGDLVGPFLVPVAQVDAFAAAVEGLPPGSRVRAGVVADPRGRDALGRATESLSRLGRLDGVEPVALEVALPAGADQDASAKDLLDGLRVPGQVQVWVEVGAQPGWREALARVAAAGDDVGAKFRTGGTAPQAVPPVEVLAALLRHAVDVETSFKLTAGLHAAVAGPDSSLGWHHGVLNVLGAVRAALNGADAEDMAVVLAETRPARLTSAARRVSDADAAVVRAFFASFGCCGVTDPVDDLVALGLLEDGRR